MPAMHARRHGLGRLASGSLRRRNPREDLLCRFSDLYGDCCTGQVADGVLTMADGHRIQFFVGCRLIGARQLAWRCRVELPSADNAR